MEHFYLQIEFKVQIGVSGAFLAKLKDGSWTFTDTKESICFGFYPTKEHAVAEAIREFGMSKQEANWI